MASASKIHIHQSAMVRVIIYSVTGGGFHHCFAGHLIEIRMAPAASVWLFLLGLH